MVKAKRNERIAVITRILCENPGKLFNLSYFSSLLGATKSSLSEDVSGLKELFEARGLGRVETLPGAAGGGGIISGGFAGTAGGISFGAGSYSERFTARAFGRIYIYG